MENSPHVAGFSLCHFPCSVPCFFVCMSAFALLPLTELFVCAFVSVSRGVYIYSCVDIYPQRCSTGGVYDGNCDFGPV